ncbi:substrate-binding domain-containing protein [Formosa sp. PL04]|uniref:GntR family transcriptional regulator n=1 Tax=Formosa sp. PL04 TaxID=3081755 RepID=UPI0029821674|nr:substrate-binding domain-containing protein [Formosa sp. PL04]MDW5289781.1 substrate-binding domain-containing protein [Formosa sp. PL04]
MLDNRIVLRNLNDNDLPKYKRIFNIFKESIETNALKTGDDIPSINEFSKTYKFSRDTVYKAYSLLKTQGFIKSTPNKGFNIIDSRVKVLLLISTFKAYKEVLYHAFMENLPKNVIVDLQFHHYNARNFKSMLDLDHGNYYKYIVMGFEHPEVEEALSHIDDDKLLLIDWKMNSSSHRNYVFQDFGQAFYNCLKDASHLFKKYKAIHFVYPEYSYHPWETVESFEKFCEDYGFKFSVIKNSKAFVVQKHIAYISINDRILYDFLNQCRLSDLEVGEDVGILSYNETPLKKLTYKSISTVSIDFAELGLKAAQFVTSNKAMQTYMPTKLIIRESL